VTSSAPTRAASSRDLPATSFTHALAAAKAAPQPSASNVTASTLPAVTRIARRTRSPQGVPPAVPTTAPEGAGPRPIGSARCSWKLARSTPASIETALGDGAGALRVAGLGLAAAAEGVDHVLLYGVAVEVTRGDASLASLVDDDERRRLGHIGSGGNPNITSGVA
jgi:hypothetical protein